MCNLYRQTQPVEAIARLFRAQAATGANFGTEVFPGYPGLVIADGIVRAMTWGFPLSLTGKQGQKLKPKPVNNARTDKLATAFWRSSFENRRCLIPMGAFAEAEGPKGRMTRSWLSVPDRPVFTCAGVWRNSAEWGPVYAMVMADCAEATADVHDRMPVIVKSEDEQLWACGTTEQAFALCRPWTGDITIERTAEPWFKRGGA